MNQISDRLRIFFSQDEDIQILHFEKLILWYNSILCELCLFKDYLKFWGNEYHWDFQKLE